MSTNRPEILLPTAYLPPVEYMAWLAVSAKAEVEVHETYPKQTWRNRCSIPSANGPLALSIPVEKPLGNHTPTRLISISSHLSWQKQHWRSIVSAYSKSAFFLFYQDLLEPFFMDQPPALLVNWNQNLLAAITEEIGLKLKPVRTITFEKAPTEKIDLRQAISPKKLTSPEKGNDLFPPYFQAFSEKYGFLQNQSVIDVLFNLGPDTLPYLENCGRKLMLQFRPG
ncbi:MAG: WbqC family protein [Bacteroidales bacterium]|nr:WbqC family protein [Bacteroidales bacterium]